MMKLFNFYMVKMVYESSKLEKQNIDDLIDIDII